MIRTRLLVLSLSGLLVLGCSKKSEPGGATSAPTEAFREVRLHPSGSALVDVLAASATTAKGLGLKPFVELGATWCNPCKELEKSMSDPLMQAAFKGTYIVHLDIDEWGAKLGPAKLSSSSIPVFFALDASGKPTGRKIDGGAWDENVPANMAPKLGAFFGAP